MVAGLLGAFAAAFCYGVGSILQAVAARRTHSAEGLDPRLLIRLFGSWPYLLGLGLDGFAFLLSIAALRSLPLFVVQSIVASFLAVTAVLGAIFLHMPLTSDRLDRPAASSPPDWSWSVCPRPRTVRSRSATRDAGPCW